MKFYFLFLIFGFSISYYSVGADWINTFVESLTPKMSEYLTNQVKISNNQSQNQNSLISNLSRNHNIHFKRLNISDVALRVTDIVTREQPTNSSFSITDVTITYKGNCDIAFNWKIFPLHIIRISYSSRVRVFITPLVSKPPFVGGVQMSILDKPSADFELSSIAKLYIVPRLKDVLANQFSDFVLKQMGYPGRISFPIDHSADIMQIRSIDRSGILAFKIVSALDLGLVPRFFVGLSKPDSFVVARLGSLVYQTESIKNNQNPVWEDKWYEIPMESYVGHIIKFELMVKGTMMTKIHGKAQVIVESSINKNVSVDLDRFIRQKKKSTFVGKLTVSLMWIPLRTIPSNTSLETLIDPKPLYKDQSQVLLTLFIYNLTSVGKANFLPKPEESKKIKIEIRIGDETTLSREVENSRVANFEQEFLFLLDKGWKDNVFTIKLGNGANSFVGKPVTRHVGKFQRNGGINTINQRIPDTNRNVTYFAKVQFLDTKAVTSNPKSNSTLPQKL